MRHIRGSEIIKSRKGPVRIHAYDIPCLGNWVKDKSLFSELADGTCPLERKNAIYRLMARNVDFSLAMRRITKVALGYKIVYFRKSQIFNKYRLKIIWGNRVSYIKNHLHHMRIYLGLFKIPQRCVNIN